MSNLKEDEKSVIESIKLKNDAWNQEVSKDRIAYMKEYYEDMVQKRLKNEDKLDESFENRLQKLQVKLDDVSVLNFMLHISAITPSSTSHFVFWDPI